MFYSYLWIIFIIVAIICAIMQSLPLLGAVLLLTATAVLMYELIHFRRLRFMVIQLYVAGALLAVPSFYTIYADYVGEWLSGGPYYLNGAGIQGNNIFSIVRGVVIILLIFMIVRETL